MNTFNPVTQTPSQAPFLAMAIYSAIASHSLASAQAFLAVYPDTNTDSVDAQIAQANRFWRLQLSMLPIDTVPVRDYLVDGANPTDWLRLFCEHVVPVIAAFGLPQVPALASNAA